MFCGWQGPLNITRLTNKEVRVTDGEKSSHFNIIQVLTDAHDEADWELNRLLQGFKHFNYGAFLVVLLNETLHQADTRTS